MEPTVYVIFRAMRDGDTEEANRVLGESMDYAARVAKEDEAKRLRTIIESHRRDSRVSDGGGTSHEYAEAVECTVNAILAEIDRRDSARPESNTESPPA